MIHLHAVTISSIYLREIHDFFHIAQLSLIELTIEMGNVSKRYSMNIFIMMFRSYSFVICFLSNEILDDMNDDVRISAFHRKLHDCESESYHYK